MSCNSSVIKLGTRSCISFKVTIFNLDVFPFDITELAQAALERLDSRTGILRITRRCHETDARDLCWLL